MYTLNTTLLLLLSCVVLSMPPFLSSFPLSFVFVFFFADFFFLSPSQSVLLFVVPGWLERAARSEAEIGDLIASAMERVGNEGVITVQVRSSAGSGGLGARSQAGPNFVGH